VQAGLSQRSSTILLCALAGALALACYWPIQDNGFVNFDDPLYVTSNPIVQQGLSGGGFLWAFSSTTAGNYHPLTMLSHMLDCQLFGLQPGGHHLTSAIFHAMNAALLCLVLARMTGRRTESLIVAALFAVHPAHVESVAWLAERKDVLSGFFFLLTIWSYLRYVERPGGGRYALTLLMLVLGLLSKPMLVTLPFLLLLLDLWPLGRTGMIWPARKESADTTVCSWCYLVFEKLPMVLLAGAMCVLTFLVQRASGAMDGGGSASSLPERAGNAVVAYVRYLFELFWPVNLSAFYPRQAWSIAQVATAGALLIAVTLAAWSLRRRKPYLLVGWLWFIGMLVPVIGIIQVGSQSMADRYLYLPMIGIAMAVVWGASDLLRFNLQLHPHAQLGWASIACTAILVSCGVLTFQDTQVWRNDQTLYAQCLRVGPDNPFAEQNLAAALAQKGDVSGALEHYQRAVDLQPNLPDARGGYGYALRLARRFDEAEVQLRIGLALDGRDPRLHSQLGMVYFDQQRWDDAARCFKDAIAIDSADFEAVYYLAMTKAADGDPAGAIALLRRAAEIQPTSVLAHYQLGMMLMKHGHDSEGVDELALAARLSPNSADVNLQFGLALLRCGRKEDAVSPLSRAARLRPDSTEAIRALASILSANPAGIGH
jgi:Flp pilus assembly protein TadD